MQDDTKKIIEEQFKALPEVVRNAILSAEVEKKFQELAQKNHLHVDQWQQIENLIMLTILGLSPPEELVNEIVKNTSLGKERAETIVDEIAETVFKPIREEMERELGHPQAKKEEGSDVEKLRDAVLAENGVQTPANTAQETAVAPGTPPPPKPEGEVVRGPASGAYKPGGTSMERKGVQGVIDDP
jgi:hypothetical protein